MKQIFWLKIGFPVVLSLVLFAWTGALGATDPPACPGYDSGQCAAVTTPVWHQDLPGAEIDNKKVSALVAHPLRPGWVAAGIDGRGIRIKGVSGGVGWEKSFDEVNMPDSAQIWALALDPGGPGNTPPAKLWAGGVYLAYQGTLDGNGNLTWVSNQFPHPVMSLAVHPEKPNVIWAGTQYRGVYKITVDAGGTIHWPEMTEVARFLPSDTILTLAIDPTDPDILYAGTNGNGLWKFKSRDGGESWPVQEHYLPGKLIHALFAPLPGGTIYAAAHPSDIFQSSDEGVTWCVGAGIPATSATFSIVADPNNPQMMYAGTGVGVYHSPDGGVTWCPFNGTTDTDGAFPPVQYFSAAIDPYSPTLYAGSEKTTGIFSTTSEIIPCGFSCKAFVPAKAVPGSLVAFNSKPASLCGTKPITYNWNIGDNPPVYPSGQGAAHAFCAPGDYLWAYSAQEESGPPGEPKSCSQNGMIRIILPGDCDKNGIVTIGEVQKAINSSNGIAPPGCEADWNEDGIVTRDEALMVIDAFLVLDICGPGSSRLPPSNATPNLRLGAVLGNPGDVVSVPVTLSNGGGSVYAAGAAVTFDADKLTPDDFVLNGTHDYGVESSVFGFSAFAAMPAPNEIRFGLFNLIHKDPLPESGPAHPAIARIRFKIKADATGTANLESVCDAADGANRLLATSCTPGSVTVKTYSIGGTVKMDSQGLAGVTVTAGTQAATTNGYGLYSISGLVNGTYTVTPSKPGYLFTPASRSITISGTSTTSAFFTATRNFTIRGHASCSIGTGQIGVPGVNLAFTGARAQTVTGDTLCPSLGFFSSEGLPAGTYTVTPSKPHFTFSPASATVALNDTTPVQEIAFTATATDTYSIKGNISYNGSGFPGVQVGLRGLGIYESTSSDTGQEGNYSFSGLPPVCYELDPEYSCKRFRNPLQDVLVSGGDVLNQNFEAFDVVLCAPCYDTLDWEMAGCARPGEPVPIECTRQARKRFQTCLTAATMQANSPLYDATLLAISVTRASGQPVPETISFVVPEEADYTFNMTNGDQVNHESMVSSATVNLEPWGEVFGPSDFNKNAPFLVKPVHLFPGTYSLTTEVRSQPGSYLTVVVSSLDFSTLP